MLSVVVGLIKLTSNESKAINRERKSNKNPRKLRQEQLWQEVPRRERRSGARERSAKRYVKKFILDFA